MKTYDEGPEPFRLTKGSIVIAITKWLARLGPEEERLAEANELLEDFLAQKPPCACGGREPIWDGGAEIFDVRGDRCQADAGAIVFRAKGIKEGQSLYLLGFLPAEEVT